MSIIKISGLNQWVDMSLFQEDPSIGANCTVEKIQAFLDEQVKVKDLKVVKAEVNTNGHFLCPDTMPGYMPPAEYEGLPPFCDICIEHNTGKLTEYITVWIPLTWNERFLGINGGGNRTLFWAPEAMGIGGRQNAMTIALRNGYACACTDGGCRSDRFFGWGVDY